MQIEIINLADKLRQIAGEMDRAGNRGLTFCVSKYDSDLMRDAAKALDARRTPGPAMRYKLVWMAQIGEVCWPDTFDTRHDAEIAANILVRTSGFIVRVESITCTAEPDAG